MSSMSDGSIPANASLRITLISTRYILGSALTATLATLGLVSVVSAFHEVPPEADLLIVELREWSADAVRIAAGFPCPTIVWMANPSPELALCAVESGIRGVLRDASSQREIVRCAEAVASGQLWIPADVSTQILTRKACRLTQRESQLVSVLSRGLRNKEIAATLGITEGTVKVYLSRLFEKMGVSDRFELALLTLRSSGSMAPDLHVASGTERRTMFPSKSRAAAAESRTAVTPPDTPQRLPA